MTDIVLSTLYSNPGVSVTSSAAVIEFLDKSNLIKEGFILAHSSKGHSSPQKGKHSMRLLVTLHLQSGTRERWMPSA